MQFRLMLSDGCFLARDGINTPTLLHTSNIVKDRHNIYISHYLGIVSYNRYNLN